MTLFELIIQDMREPFQYLPQAALICAAISTFYYISAAFVSSRRPKTSSHRPIISARRLLRAVLLFLLLTYLSVMLRESFFSRPPGSRTSVNLVFLGTWGHGAQGNAYVIENVIMFIPWGILLPFLIPRLRKNGWLCVLSAFLASVILETVQFLTQRGHCQLDDVVMNTLGALIGWMVMKAVAKAAVKAAVR